MKLIRTPFFRKRVFGQLPGWLAILAVMFLSLVPAPAQDAEDGTVDGVALFQKAQDLHEKGDLAGAIELYEKAISAVGEFPEAEYQRASALLALGRVAEAEKALRKAVDLRPDWTLALASLGSLLVGKGAYPEAEKLLVKAISIDDQNTLAYSALVELRLNSNPKPDDLKDLLARLTALTSGARTTAAAWAARAAIEFALGQKAAFRASLEKALELDPKNQFALRSKASAAIDEGDLRGAEPLVRDLESVAATAPSVRALRARLLFSSGKAEEAVALLDTIKDPTPETVALRDRIIVSATDNATSVEQLLGKRPNDPFLLGKLCRLYRTTDPEKALQYCRRASEADPSNISHAVGFAAALVQAKRYANAVELLGRLVSLSPENVTIRANLATALFQLKRYAESKEQYRWLIENQPNSAIAYYFLGIAHDQLTEYADAMANYQLFLRYADKEKNKLEIEKVNLRIPSLQKQIKEKKGK